MGYNNITWISAGATPTTAQWAQLASNDASFNDGSGFAWGASAALAGGPAWTAVVPTIGATSGTITTVSATLRYQQIGKTVNWHADVTITTNGTGAGGVTLTLPVTAQSATCAMGFGRADGVSGKMLQAKGTSTTLLTIINYDGTYPGSNGEILRLSGSYEAV